jgi:hypothetical protein
MRRSQFLQRVGLAILGTLIPKRFLAAQPDLAAVARWTPEDTLLVVTVASSRVLKHYPDYQWANWAKHAGRISTSFRRPDGRELAIDIGPGWDSKTQRDPMTEQSIVEVSDYLSGLYDAMLRLDSGKPSDFGMTDEQWEKLGFYRPKND